MEYLEYALPIVLILVVGGVVAFNLFGKKSSNKSADTKKP